MNLWESINIKRKSFRLELHKKKKESINVVFFAYLSKGHHIIDVGEFLTFRIGNHILMI